MRLRWLLVALVLLGTFASDSWGQSKQPPVQSKQAAPDQRGTEQVPLAVKILPATDAKEQAEKFEHDRKEKAVIDEKLALETQRIADYTDRLVLFTIFLFCVAVVQAGLFFWQLRYMRRGMRDAETAAKAAEDSAKATRESVTLARETAERQLRAYVYIDGGSFKQIKAEPTRIYIEAHQLFKNFGHTPAYNFRCAGRLDILDAENPVFAESPEPIGQSIIGPGGERSSNIRKGPISPDDLAAIVVKKKAIYVWGYISYVDAFGKSRTLEYYNVSSAEIDLGGGQRGWSLLPAEKTYRET
jgi:hypothetical protein